MNVLYIVGRVRMVLFYSPVLDKPMFYIRGVVLKSVKSGKKSEAKETRL